MNLLKITIIFLLSIIPVIHGAAASDADPGEIELSELVAQSQDLGVNHEQGELLTVAATKGKLHAIKLLLSKGISMESRDSFRNTPLAAASYYGHLDIAQFLLDNGANIEAVDIVGNTPLISAAGQGKYKMIRFLISRGSKINAQAGNGRTALSRSVPYYPHTFSVYSDTARVLLRAGADISLKDVLGQTALDFARNKNFPLEQLIAEEKDRKEAYRKAVSAQLKLKVVAGCKLDEIALADIIMGYAEEPITPPMDWEIGNKV